MCYLKVNRRLSVLNCSSVARSWRRGHDDLGYLLDITHIMQCVTSLAESEPMVEFTKREQCGTISGAWIYLVELSNAVVHKQ